MALVVLMLGMLAAPVHPVDEHVRAAWQWTNEERLHARFDPVAMQSRYRRYESQLKPRFRSDSTDSSAIDVVIGAETPFLLLPWEPFESLITRAFASDPRVRDYWRATYTRSSDTRLDATFWNRLESSALEYLQLREDIDQLRDVAASIDDSVRRAEVETELSKLLRSQCSKRIRALEEARRAFPDDAFDRFLYEAVARHVVVWSDEPASTINRIQGGCK